MGLPELPEIEKRLLKSKLDRLMRDSDELFKESSRILSRMSNLLGVVLSPRISTGILERLDVVSLGTSRVMIVISVRSRLVQTIIYETQVDINRYDLDRIVSILNERLSGLPLDEIVRTYADRTRDLGGDKTGIVQLILKEKATLFKNSRSDRLSRGGTQQILKQPEFNDTQEVRRLIQMIEDEGFVVKLFEEAYRDPAPGQASVTIGSELNDSRVRPYSIVTARYQLGETFGTVGVLGPMRMDYGRAVALVENIASLLNRPSDRPNQ